MRRRWRSERLALAVALAAGAGCFQFKEIPDEAQIACHAVNDTCPSGMECCQNRYCVRIGNCRCRDGREYCSLNGAIDCDGGRICTGGCWADCPGCQATCNAVEYQECRAGQYTESWFCETDQVCLIKFESGGAIPTATCYSPPQQCASPQAQECACFYGPFSTVRPCMPHEQCYDLPAAGKSCIGCSVEPIDAGHIDANRSFDREQEDSLEASMPDADAGSSAPLFNSKPEEEAVGIQPPVLGDRGCVYVSTGAPQCYGRIGTNDNYEVCCDMTAGLPAMEVEEGFRCREGSVPVAECQGYGDGCMQGVPVTGCEQASVCLWAWPTAEGLVECGSTGPAAPCVGGHWQCPIGSVPQNECGWPVCP
ncbi:MAG: hypothetical protein JXR83_17825 [Deltaproteobacteria bacterium]|nr:hypothetical protein [Deltaproteobacteria bacterium]